MTRKIRQSFLATIVPLSVAFAGCSTAKTAETVAQQRARSVVAQVSGYGHDCTSPPCTDVARACEDVVASGCGTRYVPTILDKNQQVVRAPLSCQPASKCDADDDRVDERASGATDDGDDSEDDDDRRQHS